MVSDFITGSVRLPDYPNRTMANVSGHTKRAVSACFATVMVGAGNMINPQTLRAKDAPGYRPAKIIVLVMECLIAIDMILLLLYYRWENARRDRDHVEEIMEDEHGQDVSTEDAFGGKTDWENKRFRYVY